MLLLQALDQAALGGDTSALPAALDDLLRELTQTREVLQQIAAAHSPHVRAASSAAFDRCLQTMNECEGAARQVSQQAAREPIVLLKDRMLAVEGTLAAYFEDAWTATGPTPLAGINRVCKALDGVIEAGVSNAALHLSLIQEIDRLRAGLMSDAVDWEIRAAAERVLVALQALQAEVPALELRLRRDALVEAATHWWSLGHDQRLRTPTPLRSVNAVLLLARDVLDGKTDAQSLHDHIDFLANNLEKLAVESTRVSLTDHPEMQLLRDRAIELLCGASADLRQLSELVRAGDEQAFQHLVQTLADDMWELDGCQERLRTHAESAMQIPCPRCGEACSGERQTCRNCGASLLAAESAEQPR